MQTNSSAKTRAGGWVDDYFATHLGGRLRQQLLPGLKSLSTAFTIEIAGHGAYAIGIESGVLECAEPATAPSAECHVTLDAESFARIVAAECTPQWLFVRRRLRIAGDVMRSLSAASAMEEFFRRFPFVAPVGGVA